MAPFFQQLLAPGTRLPRWFMAVVLTGAALMAWWYWTAAVQHGDLRNRDWNANDQRVYMNGASSMVSSNYTYSVSRMRMPGYMVMLSTVADPGVDYDAFFPKAKRFNVAVSLVCLVALFFSLRPWLGTGLTWCLVLVAAMQLYIFRAAYVQPEITLITLTVVGMALLVEVMRAPTWWKAVLAGLVCCLWYMTKASAFVAIVCFMAALAAKLIFSGREKWKSYLLALVLVPFAFMAPISPYLMKSYREFGSPFYNAQSNHFMWVEDGDAKHLIQRSGIDKHLEDADLGSLKELPTLKKYWASHTWKHITDRLCEGSADMMQMLMQDYTLLTYFILLWFGIMLWAISRNFDAAVTLAREHWQEVAYVAGLVVLYTFLFGWYTALKVGPRLIASVSLIPIFFCMLVTHHFLENETEEIFGTKVSAEKLLVGLFVVIWAVATVLHVPPNLALGQFGR